MSKKIGNHWTLSVRWLIGLGLTIYIASISSVACAQELNVRTERAPFFVGESIVLEVEAIDFKIDPAIEIRDSDQENVSVVFANSGRSTSTQIFQSGGKFVRNQIVKTTYSYRVEFSKPGRYSIGPFEANAGGSKVTHPAVTFNVSDVETTTDMKVEISLPQENLYPGQQVAVELRWIFAGNPSLVKGLTIRNEIFERFRFKDSVLQRRQSAIPITTSKGVQAFPATFTEEEIDGKKCIVGTVKRIMIPDKPEVVSLPPTFVSFQKVTGSRRSNDIFDGFFDVQTDTVPYKGIGERVSFVVKPFPKSGQPDSFHGAVGSKFSIATTVNRDKVRTGDPMTLQINIQGDGNIESIGLPPLEHSFREADFDWPEGDFPGVAEGNKKQFLVNMQAKQASLSEIPPVEFSYFDPVLEDYVTIRSGAIPIEVSQGEVVSSKDIVGQIKSGLSAEDVGTKMDLAIETDVDQLIQTPSKSNWLEYGIYFVGLVLVSCSLFVSRKANPKKQFKQDKKQLVIWRKDLEHLFKDQQDRPAFLSRLSDHLRSLQSTLSQIPKSQNRLNSKIEEDLDQLISDIDKVSYRPSASSAEEIQQLVASAMQISKELL